MHSNVATAHDPRTLDLAARMLALHGPCYASPAFTYVRDHARAAALRLDHAAQLVRDADRRAAALLTAPCEWCGRAIAGERVEVAGTVMHPACEREMAADLGYLTAAPLSVVLAPAPTLEPWYLDESQPAVFDAERDAVLSHGYALGYADGAEIERRIAA